MRSIQKEGEEKRGRVKVFAFRDMSAVMEGAVLENRIELPGMEIA